MIKLEFESIRKLREFLADPRRDWDSVALQGLDLLDPTLDTRLQQEAIVSTSVFLGCRMTPALAARAAVAGAFIIPPRDGVFNAFRGDVYTAAELLDGYDRRNPSTYRRTTDWRCYEASMEEATKRKRSNLGIGDVILFRLHDVHVEDALEEYLRRDPANAKTWKRTVAIMGGHDLERLEKMADGSGRDAPFMQLALLSAKFAAAGSTIVTGGGPGAMEAGNLGAWFASYPESDLRAAVRLLQRVPKIQPISPGSPRWNSGEWLDPAFEVIEKYPRDKGDVRTESVGIPTWFYGHEPPNPFPTHIAKYFENSLREEGLLAVASHGLIVSEGNAGTVQEIFQDACQNYYKVYGDPVPVVLLGTSYWNRSGFGVVGPKAKPVWPLLQQLGSEKGFGHLLKLTDSIDDTFTFISQPPQP